MKKIYVIALMMLMIPFVAFGQLAVGGVFYAKSPLLFGDSVSIEDANVEQLCLGGDIRLKAGWLYLESVLIGSTGSVNGLDMFFDAGITMDLAMIRFSVGAGPNLSWNFNSSPIIQTGMNAKLSADVMLNKLSLGISYIMALKYNDHVEVYNKSGLVGFQALYWM